MSRHLKRGDIVEVRSLAEILSTLDNDASIDGMPFMAEMLQYAGKQFSVTHRVEKICDTASGNWDPPSSRRMYDTVLLDDLRCDGSAHGGCQAGCRIYWKESWLRRTDQETRPASEVDGAHARLEDLAAAGGRAVRDHNGTRAEIYRCQATEALAATEPLSAFDPRQYFRELASGNVGWLRFGRVSVRASISLISLILRLPGIARRLRRVVTRRRSQQRALGPARPSWTSSPVKWWKCGRAKRSRRASTAMASPADSGMTRPRWVLSQVVATGSRTASSALSTSERAR